MQALTRLPGQYFPGDIVLVTPLSENAIPAIWMAIVTGPYPDDPTRVLFRNGSTINARHLRYHVKYLAIEPVINKFTAYVEMARESIKRDVFAIDDCCVGFIDPSDPAMGIQIYIDGRTAEFANGS